VAAPADAGRGLERLRLYTSSLAGRPVDVATTKPGELPWTDGTTVYVDAFAETSDQIRMLSVQASLLAAGSLSPTVLRQLVRRPKLARRYLAVEGHRALAVNEALLPPALRQLVDHTIAAHTTSAEQSLVVARGRVTDAPPEFGTIRARPLLAAIERDTEAVVRTSGDLIELVDELDKDDDEDASDDGLSSPVGGGGAIGRQLRRLFRATRGRDGGPPGADAATHVTMSGLGSGHHATVAVTPARTLEDASPFVQRDTTYPEWDVHRHVYRRQWCTVIESDAPTGRSSTSVRDEFGLQRPLARLGLELTPCRRQRQGEDIDIDAIVELHVDHLAGVPHKDDAYVETLRRRRDLAVLVLLDVSGSAGEPGAAGKPVHEHQRSAAAALTVALHELGDRVALFAFNSRGRTAVQFLRVKHFDDRLDGRVAQRLGGLTPAAFTRLGAAIRHGTAALEAHGGTQRRLLVVLSDGFAYDHGYEGVYGEADARRALVEARRRGVGCLCLSVGAGTDAAALQRVFGAAAHASVSRPEQLRGVIGPLFRAGIASAEAHRRNFQRKERLHARERSSDDGSAVLRAGR